MFKKSEYYEREKVHPATARWLTQHEYSFQHEVKMPYYGRADFIAQHKHDGHILIVECKIYGYDCHHAIRQLLDYRDQYDKTAKIAIALPSMAISDEVRELCKKREVILIEVSLLVIVDIVPSPDWLFPDVYGFSELEFEDNSNV